MQQGYGYNWIAGARQNRSSSRVMRKALSRRWLKPEKKYVIYNTSVSLTGTANAASTRISPIAVAQGAAQGQRIGNMIRGRFLHVRMRCTFTGSQNYTMPFRVVLWHPEVDAVTATSYMDGTTNINILDYQRVFIHKEFNFDLTCRTDGEDDTGPVPWVWTGEVTIPWPRSIKFSGTGTDMTLEKDFLYATVHSFNSFGTSVVALATECRLTYTDC